ncbi:MAG: S-layer homology domain-containing protein, partial [Megasphaera sp.]|nr:S-layer homology domain-containing protein [Megasphaera sp.]
GYKDEDGVSHQVATLDDGMKYMGDSGTLAKTRLNQTVNVVGGVTDSTALTDGNIGTVSSQDTEGGDATVTVKLNKDLTNLNSITMGAAAGDTTVSLGTDGLHNGGNKITNVADGDVTETSKDAVNGSQLYEATTGVTTKGLQFAANSGDTVTNKLGSTVTVAGAGTKDDSSYSGDNIKTKVSQDADGNTTIDVMLDNNMSIGGKDGKDGSIGINGADGVSGVGIDGKDGISIKGADGKDGVTIKGVNGADGKDGTEGHIGLTGSKGTDGTNATADIHVKPGDPGVNGADGTTMTRVVYEDQDGIPHQVATLDDGMKYMGDSGDTAKVKLNKTVNVVGGVTDSTKLSDNNIGVVSSQDGDNGKLEIKLAKDLTGLDSISADTVKAGDTVTISKDGIDNGGQKITNVAKGTDPTDAVNVSQLTDQNTDLINKGLKFGANSGDIVTNKLGSTVTVQGAGTKDDSNYSGDNIKTKVSQDADGNTTIDVMLDNNLSIGGKDGKDGSIGINGADGVSGVGIDGKDGISIKGADGKDGVTIKGVNGADGKDGTEGHIGLTGSKGTDGTNATADIHVKPGDPGVNGADGTTMTRVVYEDQDGTPHQVATLDDGMKYMGDSGTTAKVKLNKIVNIVGGVKNENLLSDNNIGVVSSQDGDNGKLTVKLAKDLSGLNSITFGDATVVNPVSIGSTGLSNGGKKITNVADGDVSATSTDAVNGSQLSKSAAAATTTLENGTNTTVSYRANADGSKTYKVDVDANSTFGTGDTAINVNGVTGKITAGTGDNAVTIDGTNGTVKAGKVTIDGTNGTVTAGKVTINGTNGTVTAGKVTINGTAGTVNGLTNTTWDSEHYVSGQGATEDQLKAVSDKADNAAKLGKQHATVTVNNGSANGSLVMHTSTNSNDGTNYDISLSDNINVGGTTSNGSIGVNGSDGTNGVTISAKDGKDGHIGINGKDGSSADITVHDGVAGVNGKDGETQTRITYADQNGTSHDAATLDDGMKYSGDTGSAAVTLNKNVSVVGETTEGKNLTTGNIGVEAAQDGDNAKLVVKLADNLTGLKSITTENVNTTTIKVGDTVTINKDGIDAGNKKITNVANGQISSGSSDAVNGSQLYAVQQNVTNINNDLTNLDNRVSNMDDRINKVGAGAAALASLHPLDFDPDDKWDFAAGYGNYRNANAAAVGAFYRPNEDTMLSIGGSFGNGENMLNAGISFKLGQGNHVSTSKVAMAKEIKDMRKEMEAMKSAILDQNAGRKLDTSKLQLFPDVPENHWAYEDVAVLAGNGIIKGYPDGTFDGNRPMTRYEFASMLYKAMLNGAKLSDKMLNEFAPELERFTVDAVHTDKNGNATVERVRVVKEQTNK